MVNRFGIPPGFPTVRRVNSPVRFMASVSVRRAPFLTGIFLCTSSVRQETIYSGINTYMKLKQLIKEIHDSESLSARDIYNLYFLLTLSQVRPDLFKTDYGAYTLEYYTNQFKRKWMTIFTRMMQKQLAKYSSRNRIDPDFDKTRIDSNSPNVLAGLMKKTHRTQKFDDKGNIRRNDRWELLGDDLIKLDNASSVSDILMTIDHMNNIVHNTGTSMLDHLSNYRGELLKALEFKKHATSLLQYKGLVDKDLDQLMEV
jgi:hypothetical protein